MGRYPANELTGRGPIPRRVRFPPSGMRRWGSIRYYPRFPEAIPVRGAGCPRVTQPFATLCTPEGALTVRLACVKRAASVHPEPGSNSPFKIAPALAGVSALSTSVRPWPYDPLIFGFTKKIHVVLIRTQESTPGDFRSGSKQFR